MALITLRQLLDHAGENGYGMPAFNVTNLETLQAVMDAAVATESPVIIQASRSARKYMGDIFFNGLFTAAAKAYPAIPIVVHQDHGNSLDTCVSAMDYGFTSVMMDGSLKADGKTPSDFEYNSSVTRSVTDAAHQRGVSVEGEIGVLGSLETGKGDKEDGHGFEGTLSKDQLLTKPEDAEAFVAATNVDALAVACGTSHGAYKFSQKPTGETLAMSTIEAIHARLPNTHLVMHGSSSVPQDLQDLINKFGGAIPQTYGVPLAEIARGIKSGVRKVNIDTDLRMAFTGAVRKFMAEHPDSFDVRGILKPARERIAAECVERNKAFGCAGMAGKIKPLSLDQMASRYRTGALAA
jgi:fructose-bisphosphate aldolase, class II